MKRYVLLDRDGTINVEKNYLADPELLELLPGALEGLKSLADLGLGLVVITNQSGIGRGLMTEQQVDAVHQRLRELLHVGNVQLQGIYVCPHHPQTPCHCRKPATGLVQQAAADCGFVPEHCFLIGDKPSDIALGKNIGAVSLLVRTGYGWQSEQADDLQADDIVDDLPQAACWITKHLSQFPAPTPTASALRPRPAT